MDAYIINKNKFKNYIVFLLPLIPFLALFYNHMIDDSYITLSYAKNFSANYIWAMKCCTVSNAATSPLNVIFEFFLIKVGIPPLIVVLVITFFCIFFVSLILQSYEKSKIFPHCFGVIVSFLLATNPWLDSTIGLEGFILVLYMFVVSYAIDFKIKYILCLALGLSFSIRPELSIMNILVVFYLFIKNRKYAIQVFMYSSAIVLLGIIISWYFLGSPVPDTFFIKKAQKSWGNYNFFNGMFLYLKAYPTAVILSLVPLVFTFFSIKAKIPTGIKIAFVFFPVLHFVAYSALKVPPYHWYYVPEIASIIVLGSIGIYKISRNVYMFYIISTLLILANMTFVYSYVSKSGFTPINTNWASVSKYEEVSRWVNENTNEKEIFLSAELGVMQFYSNANLINEFSDRNILLEKENKAKGFQKHIYEFLFKKLVVSEHRSQIEIISAPTENCREGYLKKWYINSPWTKSGSICVYKKAP